MGDPDLSAVKLHQTLHGYSDGHRLLAASRNFPREAERALLMLTDISGPPTAGLFDSYLTGWTVPGAGAYAVARTWLATELNRPGCVFTHTLLIDVADLARIPDLAILRTLFRRPRRGESWLAYGQAAVLPLSPSGPEPPARPACSERDAARVLAALYGRTDGPAWLVADGPDRVEDLVLTVWSQAWPRLRRTLDFCTWALTPRALEGDPFDLQVVPSAMRRQLQRDRDAEAVVILTARRGDEPGSGTVPSWAEEAARDLVGESDGQVRQFLWEFGKEVSAGRAVFPSLVEIATQIELVRQGRLPLGVLVDSVGSRFRATDEARRLKAALFGDRLTGEPPLLPSLGEGDLLRALAATAEHAGLDAEALGVKQRTMLLWKTQPAEALRLGQEVAEAGPPTRLGAEILTGLAEALGPADAPSIRARSPRLIAELALRNHSLAAPPPPPPPPPPPLAPPPRTLVGSRDTGPFPDPRLVQVEPPRAGSREMPRAGAETTHEVAARGVEPVTVAGTLDWLDGADRAPDISERRPGWRQLLEERPAEVADWLIRAAGPRPWSVALVASLLDPHSAEARRIGADVWLRVTEGLEAALDRPACLGLMAYLLALGFDNAGPGAEALVARAFDPVYKAAAGEELPAEAWKLLSSRLPTVARWRDGDPRERLRRGLIERFIRHGWPPEHLLRVAHDDFTFQRLVVVCESSREGRALLKRLATEVAAGRVEATGMQRTALAPYA